MATCNECMSAGCGGGRTEEKLPEKRRKPPQQQSQSQSAQAVGRCCHWSTTVASLLVVHAAVAAIKTFNVACSSRVSLLLCGCGVFFPFFFSFRFFDARDCENVKTAATSLCLVCTPPLSLVGVGQVLKNKQKIRRNNNNNHVRQLRTLAMRRPGDSAAAAAAATTTTTSSSSSSGTPRAS